MVKRYLAGIGKAANSWRSSASGVTGRLTWLDPRLIGSFLGAACLFMAAIAAVVGLLYLYSSEREQLARIPLLIQIFSCFIVILSFILIKLMMAERNVVLDDFKSFQALLGPGSAGSNSDRALGLTTEKLVHIRMKSQTSSSAAKRWWTLVEGALEIYKRPDGQTGWFSVRPIEDVLTEDKLIWNTYHSSFHQAVPGILTALGLLATFTAILQGLSAVTYNPQDASHPVSGIESLINGLSGKFLSSIVALLASILFTFIEKKLCERSLSLAYSELLTRFEHAIPFLPQSRILMDLQSTLAGYFGVRREQIEEHASWGQA
jgi:hypothetical protein